MIRSMTGFGRAEAELDGRTLVAEVRSVNHRFLEVSLRMPRGLQALENKLRKHVQERVSRGKLNLTVAWKGAGESGGEASVDFDLAARYVTLLEELRGRFDFRDPVTLGQILALPDLVTWVEPSLDAKTSWSLLTRSVDAAMDDLVAMREAEGKTLAKDLLDRNKTLTSHLKVIEKRAPERVREAKERLHTRVAELLQGEAEVDMDRLAVEAGFQAERMDCTEETVRLRSHVDQFRDTIKKGGSVGRKLNFLTQEMNREANTIGSKSYDSTISHEVIGLKEEIEILREQIQNIE